LPQKTTASPRSRPRGREENSGGGEEKLLVTKRLIELKNGKRRNYMHQKIKYAAETGAWALPAEKSMREGGLWKVPTT